MYGCSQSPDTPKRLKSLRCLSTCDKAYSLHFSRYSATVISLRLTPLLVNTCSIGKPWVSQPGT